MENSYPRQGKGIPVTQAPENVGHHTIHLVCCHGGGQCAFRSQKLFQVHKIVPSAPLSGAMAKLLRRPDCSRGLWKCRNVLEENSLFNTLKKELSDVTQSGLRCKMNGF